METIVYFADKSVRFATAAPADAPAVCPAAEISRAKIVQILETCNSVWVVSPSPEEAFARFAADFATVEAAGGVVTDPAGRWLLMRRNGRWDLPKGHIEPGEDAATAAVREIAEETGAVAAVTHPLCATWHAYWFPKTRRWELKRTWWYALRAVSAERLAPQTEEGIETVGWYAPAEVDTLLKESFPTIRCVAAAMRRAEQAQPRGL